MFNKKEYLQKGYFKIQNVISNNQIKRFNNDIDEICNNLSRHSNVEQDNNKFIKIFKNTTSRKYLYILLQDFRIIKQISADIDKKLSEIGVYESLNFIAPSIKNALLISLPGETKYDNPLHQDIYNYHSKRFIKIWAPLTKVGNFEGSMQVFNASHKMGFIEPEYHNSPDYPEIDDNLLRGIDSEIMDFEAGPVVLFNPLIVHKSVINQSNKVRFVLGLDIQDIAAVPMSNDEDSLITRMAQISQERKHRREKIKG